MSGYVASARIVRATPRFARPARIVDESDGLPPTAPDVVPIVDAATIPDPGPTLAERWEAARERWAQMTFYLFSPESWR